MKSRVNAARRPQGRLAPLAFALSLSIGAGLSAPYDAEASAFSNTADALRAASFAVLPTDDVRARPGFGGGEEFTPPDAEGRANYVVVLADPALPAYDGRLPGLPRAPRTPAGVRPAHLDANSPAARAYVAHLQGRQDRFLTEAAGTLGRSIAAEARFQHALNAVVLKLTAAEASQLAQRGDVRNVQRERRRQLRTYDTPAFIGAADLWNAAGGPFKGEGMVIGVIDTGINYLSNSFKATGDDGYTHVNPLGAGTFLGSCNGGADAGRCNAKLIGMYDFDGNGTAIDLLEHGSHTASTSGGNVVNNASHSGGTFNLSGIAPHANIIAYDGCGHGTNGCSDTALLNSINQAIANGVDVINYSIGGPNDGPWLDAQDQAFLNAGAAGIFVAAAAGNDGPNEVTTDSYAPWYTSVGATSPRGLPGFTLTATGWGGSATLLPGAAPAPSQAFTNAPLIESPNFADGSNDGCAAYPANYFRGGHAGAGAQGIAVLHLDQNASNCASGTRRTNAANAGAVAVVFVDPEYINLGATGASYSMLMGDWTALKAAGVNVTSGNATGSIGFPIGPGTRTADILVGFSSRGPTKWGTLKPDLSAPGDTILAAVSPAAANQYNASAAGLYNVMSGTSMATPHVAGAAAIVRQARPAWTPFEVKSALMSTAVQGQTLSDGSPADPNQRGAGRIDPSLAAKAGFVMDETIANFQAANPASGGSPASLNLASYYHANCIGVCSFPRTVKSTGKAATWTLAVSGLPAGSVSLSTSMFTLTTTGSQAFTLDVDSSQLTPNQWNYGSLTLTPSDNTIPTARFPIAIRGATATLGVTPTPMNVSAQTGTSTVVNLAISNTGNPTLNWTIPTTTLKGTIVDRPGSLALDGIDFDWTVVASGTAITSTNANNRYGADWFEIFSNGTTLAELQMEGVGYDSVNQFILPIESFATQMAFRVWGEASNLPNGFPGGGTAPLFAWNGAPDAAALAYDGYRVKLDVAGSGATNNPLNTGRYWLNFAPTVEGTNNHFYQLAPNIGSKTTVAVARCPNQGSGGNPANCNNTWKPINTNATQFAGTNAYAMKVVVNAVCGAPWMSYSSNSGALGTNGIDDVAVTLNATALAAGTYKAYLCVSGNGTSPPFFLGGQDSFIVPVTFTVGAANVNDAPVFTGSPYAFSVNAGAAAATAVGTVTATDADAGQTRTYSIVSGNTGNAFTINATTGAIAVATPAAVTVANSPFTLRVQATDNGTPALSDQANAVVTVNPPIGNNPPVVANAIADQSSAENDAINLSLASTFSDPDGNPLTLSLTAGTLPPGLSLVGNAITGTLTFASAGTYNGITITANDGNGGTVSDTFSWTVASTNRAPTVANAVADQSDAEGEVINLSLATVFADADGDTLSLSLTAGSLPPGLSLAGNAITGTLSFASAGTYNGIVITANDGNGGTISDTFAWAVSGTNQAPTVANAIADQSDAEGEAINLSLATVFADADGDTLSLSLTGNPLPPGLSLVGNAITGTLSFASAGTYNGIVVSADDGNGGTISDTFAWIVSGTNQAPTVANAIADQSDTEGESINLDLSTVFADSDGDTLTLSLTGSPLPPGLSLVGNAITGTLSFASAGTYNGIAITADDGNGGTISDTFSWTVSGTNQSPTVVNAIADQSDAEGETINLDLSTVFADADGDTLSLSLTAGSLPPGLSLVGNAITGTLSFASAGTYNGIVITADDGNGGTISDTFAWTVSGTNQAPTVANAIADQSDAEGEVINLDLSTVFADADGDALSLSLTGNPLPPGLSLVGNAITGTLSFASAGTYNGIVVSANDGNGGTISDTFSWTVSGTNQAPTVANAISDQSDVEGETINLSLATAFADADGDGLTLALAGGTLPPGLSLVGNAITGTLTLASAGAYPGIVIEASDGNGGTVADSFDWNISATNQAPTVANAIADQSDAEGEAINLSLANVFADADGDTLSLSLTAGSLPPGLSLAGNAITGTLTFASAGTYNGITITADDGNGGSISDTFSWTVSGTNQAPTVANAIADQSDAEGESINLNLANVFADADGDTLSLSLTGGSLPPGLSLVGNAITGTLTFASAGTYNGIVITADDGNGDTISDTFAWTVSGANQAPTVANAIADQSDAEGEAINLSLANVFADADGDTLSLSLTGNPLPPGLSLVGNAITGTLSFASAGAYNGIVITADDGNGDTVSDTFSWAVSGTNQAPTVANAIADQSDAEGESINLNLANVFADADGNTLSLSLTAGSLPPGLSLVGNAITGTLTFAAAGSYNGITITANDGNGGTVSDTFTWTVSGANQAPTVTNAIADQSDVEGEAVNLNLANVFADADGDTLTLSLTGGSLPPGLSLVGNAITGTLSFASAGTYNGITITADDGNGDTVSDTFAWTVSGTNQAPTVANAIADQSDVEGEAVNLNLANVFADADGDTLTLSLTGGSLPPGLSLVGNAITGTLTFASAGTYNGITITANDGNGGNVSDTFSWTVSGTNQAPTVTNAIADQSDAEGDTINLDLATVFADADGNPLTLSLTAGALPPGLAFDGTAITGTLTFAAAGSYGGITITANDGNGGTVGDTFTWTVADTNRAPAFTDEPYDFLTTEGAATGTPIGTLTADDADAGAVLTYAITGGNTGAAFAIDPATGAITAATPAAVIIGTFTLTVTVSDGTDSDTATVTITVEGGAPLPDLIFRDGFED